MKPFKFILTGLLAALALAGIAAAQTPIYISGAPATRKIWNIAISDTLAASTTGGAGALTIYWSGTSGFNSANQVVWTGGKVGGNAVTVYASWTGSTEGNQAVAINPPESNANVEVEFLNLANLSAAGGGYTLDATNKQYPHFNLSDTFQATIPFHGKVTVTSPATNYVTLTEAPTTNPAITGFKIVANNGSPARLNNITPFAAQQLFTGASGLPLSFFSGLPADESTLVYPVGRDIGSGARYAFLAESGIGTANSDNLFQYTANNSGGVISSYSDSTAGTVNLISFGAGGGGYSSFTPVLTALSATSTNAIGYFVTYVTDTDATTAIAAGAHELAWNGVYYNPNNTFEGAHNTAPTPIAEGQYDFWSYLHVLYNSSWISANAPISETFANSLAADLATDTATGAILTSDVQVGRNFDGGPIYPTYNVNSY